jgi:hypothetical protein
MKKEYFKYIEWIIMAVLFFGLIKLSKDFGYIEKLKPESQTDKYLMIVGIIIIAHIVLMVHELGHLITGLVQGFGFDLFVVGFLGIKKEEGKTRFYWNTNLGYYGGVAATSPRDDSKDNPQKFARVLLAGPIASVLFAIICLSVAGLLVKPLGMIVYTGGITSVAIFLATTIPSKTGMFFTDRKRYQRLVTPGKAQQVELASLSIMGKFSKDHSYQNIKKEEIELLISEETPFVSYYGLFNMICWQLEHTGKVEENIKEQYEALSQKMTKSLVVTFNKEIEKYAEKHKTIE